MNIKELSQLYYLNREIGKDQTRLRELEAKSLPGAQIITGIPHGDSLADKVGNYAAEMADLRGIIEANIQRCYYELNKLNRYINSIDDSEIRLILSLRFVNGFSWRQVAECIGEGYTEDAVKKACYRFLSKI